MQRREQILAGGLGAAVLLWGGLGLYDSQIGGPLQAKDAELVQAQQDSRDTRSEWKGLLKSQKLVRDAVSDSLPPRPEDAQRVYLKWVQELAELSQWKAITPNKTLDARTQLGKIGVRVPVTLTAKARLQEVATFLWHFERTDLLQRVASLELVSPSADGDPEFTVKITLEGIALAAAETRTRLFPETVLASAVDEKATTIQVADGAGFLAQPPFRVRIGGEFATVTAVVGKSWTLNRGVDGTQPAPHPGNSSVESAPFRAPEPRREQGIASYQQLLERSGFAKPAPLIEFKPRLASDTLPALTRGEPWPAELKVAGWNPIWPAAKFELVKPPPGLKITPEGKLDWVVPAEAQARDYIVRVIARAGEVTKVETDIRVTLREKNRPPKFEPVTTALRAFVGQPLTFQVVAKDEDPGNRITYALTGQVPAGMTIDSSRGTISWTPEEIAEAAPLAFQVTATDTPGLVATLEIRGQLDDDHAQFTYLIASVDKGDSRFAWLHDRLTNTKTEVHVGDAVKASELEFVIDSIDSEGIAIRMGAARQRVELGQHLRQGKALPAAPKTPPPPPLAVPLEKSPDAASE
jgi:Putative Ig domain